MTLHVPDSLDFDLDLDVEDVHPDIIAIDAQNLFYRGLYSNRGLTTSNGQRVDGIYGFHRLLKYTIEAYPGATFVVCWDGGSQRRKSILKHYKKSRKQYDEVSGEQLPPDEETRQRYEQIRQSRRLCDILGIPSLWIPGLEADDIIGLIARSNKNTTIVSTDRDYFQLLELESTRLDRGDRLESQLLDKRSYTAKYKNSPLQRRLLHCILGDSSDDIPNVLGDLAIEFGKRMAADFVSSVSDKYLRPCDWNHFFDHSMKRGGCFQMLAARRARVMLNYHLVDLVDVPLADDRQIKRLKKIASTQRSLNEDMYHEFLLEFQFRSVITNMESVLGTFRKMHRNTRFLRFA
jgi:5'-3' exonuclease